ncbi:hypothetical protein WJX77_008314 [Trebouxia sp. C0004]
MCRHRAIASCVLLLLITLQASYVSGLDRNLIPGHSCNREILRFGSESIRYSLEDLKPDTGYEVRVSYPATVPSKVTLQLISRNSAQPVHTHRRQLLDTEKIIFYTDDLATYQGQEHIVEIQAEATGIHRDGPAAKPDYFLYNIGQLDLGPAQLCDAVLAELVLGVPRDAFPVVMMVFFAVMAVALLLPWWVNHAVPAMLSFVAAGRSTAHTVHAA